MNIPGQLRSRKSVWDPLSRVGKGMLPLASRIVGMGLGYQLGGLQGIRVTAKFLRIHPLSVLQLDKDAEIDMKGPLSIGFPFREGAPMPGPLRSGLVINAKGRLVTHNNVEIAKGAHLHVSPGACIELEDRVQIGYSSLLVAREKISVGADSLISWNVTIMDSHLHHLEDTPYSRPVKIGKEVWIGHGVTVMPGVTIGDGAVIGARAVITKDVPAGTTVVGEAASPLPHHKVWKR